MKKMTTKQGMTRRETLRLLGAAGTTALLADGGQMLAPLLPGAGNATPDFTDLLHQNLFGAHAMPVVTRPVEALACALKPATTEGPFFVDERLNRSDIRADPTGNSATRTGAPLKIRINVFRTSDGATCTPLSGALVDLWHADATGGYSDVSGAGNPNNVGQKWLRGYQLSDNNGAVEFTTVWPGYYNGRAVHLHFKVRLFSGTTRTYEFTSQLFFTDTQTDAIYTANPTLYSSAFLTRGTKNANDGIYQASLLLAMTQESGVQVGTIDVGLSNVPATVASVSTVSAASFTSGVAPESIASLFGTGLATTTASAATTTLPTTLGGVSVTVRDSAGTTRNAPLFFVSPGQINYQIPAGTAAGTATVAVLQGTTSVGEGTINVTAVKPGLFTFNSGGTGLPAAYLIRVRNGVQTFESLATYNTGTSSFNAVPIDLSASADQVYLVLFGTGIRNAGALSGVTCTVGGTNATVAYAGSQSGFVGVDQVNVLLPNSLSGRNANLDVALSVNGTAANTVSVNVR
ncbi:MAG: hypothetical protein ACKV2V_18875 [Blastocatellia bacterium]